MTRKTESEQVKLDCPARVHIRDILVYTEYGVEGGHGLKSVKDPTDADCYVSSAALMFMFY